MATKKYVLQLLKSYNTMTHRLAILNYELKNLKPLTDEEVIESMALHSPGNAPAVEQGISDPTAEIAQRYPETKYNQYHDAVLAIQNEIQLLRTDTERLETYVENLRPQEAAVIKGYYFEKKAWNDLQQEYPYITLKTLMRYRDKGVQRLAEMYADLVNLGLIEIQDEEVYL